MIYRTSTDRKRIFVYFKYKNENLCIAIDNDDVTLEQSVANYKFLEKADEIY